MLREAEVKHCPPLGSLASVAEIWTLVEEEVRWTISRLVVAPYRVPFHLLS